MTPGPSERPANSKDANQVAPNLTGCFSKVIYLKTLLLKAFRIESVEPGNHCKFKLFFRFNNLSPTIQYCQIIRLICKMFESQTLRVPGRSKPSIETISSTFVITTFWRRFQTGKRLNNRTLTVLLRSTAKSSIVSLFWRFELIVSTTCVDLVCFLKTTIYPSFKVYNLKIGTRKSLFDCFSFLWNFLPECPEVRNLNPGNSHDSDSIK